jgi:anti-sigma factor ChrR (cupin superfamily)
MQSHPPREQLLAYCLGSANSVAIWVLECHLLLCPECRDRVAEIDRTHVRPDPTPAAPGRRRMERRMIR